MKKNILLILALQIAVSFIYGCAFEEQYVPDFEGNNKKILWKNSQY